MRSDVKKYTVTATDQGQRLDVLLSQKLKPLSRSQIQKLIINKLVTVNGRTKSKHYSLRLGDKINIQPGPVSTVGHSPLPLVKIIKATEDYIVVNKPTGLVVHPDSKHTLDQTLIGQILKKYPGIAKIGDNIKRPGIVHRLDKPVSGVMVIARTTEMFEHLKKQFQQRKVKKTYIALLHGQITEAKGQLDFTLARKKTGYMAARPATEAGREALTDYKLIKKYNKYSLVEAHPITGRMHQIRSHFAAFGHPIVGEKLYISKKYKKDRLNSQINRLFLHSKQIKFYDLNHAQVNFESPLPGELFKVLKQMDSD